MSIRHVVAAVLLTGGVGIALICCIGVLVLDDAFDRLHFITSANTLSSAFIALAVAVGTPFSNATLKTILLLVLMIISGPILSHATARAVRIRRHGEWRIFPEEVAVDESDLGLSKTTADARTDESNQKPDSEEQAGPERVRPDHEAVARRLLSKIGPGRQQPDETQRRRKSWRNQGR